MDQSKITRINELARKAKAEGLTDAEKEEQALLRREYIDAMRGSLESTLSNTYIKSPDGSMKKLERKGKDE